MMDVLKRLKREAFTLYYVARDPRTPWYARALAGAVAAYAFSPIDLIPDVIPVIGFLDDLVIVPIGVALTLKLVPPDVVGDCRERARAAAARPTSRAGAEAIIAVWLALVALIVVWLARAIG